MRDRKTCSNCGAWTHVTTADTGLRWGFCAALPSITYVAEIEEGTCDKCGMVPHTSVPCVKLMPEPYPGESCDEWRGP